MKEIDKIRAQIEQSQVVLKSVEELIPYAKNSRKHSQEQITKIASSIKHYGFTNPVLIRKDGDILAGHGRVMAAKKLKLTEVPCVVLEMNDVDARAYVIADNQLALASEWDEDILKSEIDSLGQDGFELDLLGFDAPTEFEFNPPDENKTDKEQKFFFLKITLQNENDHQMLFDELVERGFKVKV